MHSIWQFPKIGGPQCRPQNIIVRILGTPQKSTPLFGKAPSNPEEAFPPSWNSLGPGYQAMQEWNEVEISLITGAQI